MSEALTAERILEAAEETLRRFGPGKTTVVDVARALGVSHGSVYRHFPTKAALRDAVAERWLERVNTPLRPLTTAEGPATERLRSWLEQLSKTKRRMAREDPELFATYHALATESREVIRVHLETLAGMVARIISDGVSRGEFEVEEPHRAARAVLTATTRFHNPAHASEWDEPELDAEFEEVWALLLLGLASGRR
ncbi:transcriptional regulator, TetR family [Actinopolyspora lacussalsi subsp. righensis]|uniref:Transcriptional regulator, TetR family n=1 Tax=Actinopolyspora righensis TaxID=995060 RepID=A0A1I6Y8F7_9ACTN|nr:TetR family transcriptional regulator [Actinopolyspora righensis]SFT46752.1 transcriptional regulator, TetR family [Actinopolyspora righensis]